MSAMSGMIIRQFEAQFTRDGLGYRFRPAMQGAAVWVTAAERDCAVEGYARAMNRLWWLFVAILVAYLVVIAAVLTSTDLIGSPRRAEMLMATGLGATMLIYWWQLNRVTKKARKVLPDRPVVALPLDPTEFRRARIHAQSWTVFLTGPLGAALLWAQFGPRSNIFAGWHFAWPVGMAAYVGWMTYFAVRKWRIDRSDFAH